MEKKDKELEESFIDMPLISVLMPVYNVEVYLAEAIESILNQTLGDFELIILDDGSPDGSGDVAKTFTDKRIIYHRNEVNLGLANNLNVGLKMAKGKYIARMDGDDISLPKRFQTQIDFLEAHPDIDLCSCALQMFGTENTVWVREADPEAVKITMMFYSPVLHATSVWRRESFEKHNLYYDQNAFPAEDYELWSRAVFHCKLVNIPQVLYRYRIHGIQVTKTDERRDEKCRQIRINYLKETLPSLDPIDLDLFVLRYLNKRDINLENVKSLKQIYSTIIQANFKDKFFNQSILKKKLNRYYQGLIFQLLVDYKYSIFKYLKNTSLLFELRPQQIVKLFLK